MSEKHNGADELPLGFGMALAQNTRAMKVFADMTEPEQKQCLDKARSVNSKAEMQGLVDNIAEGKNKE